MQNVISRIGAIFSLVVLMTGIAFVAVPIATTKPRDIAWFVAPASIVFIGAAIVFVWLLLVVLPIRYWWQHRVTRIDGRAIE